MGQRLLVVCFHYVSYPGMHDKFFSVFNGTVHIVSYLAWKPLHLITVHDTSFWSALFRHCISNSLINFTNCKARYAIFSCVTVDIMIRIPFQCISCKKYFAINHRKMMLTNVRLQQYDTFSDTYKDRSIIAPIWNQLYKIPLNIIICNGKCI